MFLTLSADQQRELSREAEPENAVAQIPLSEIDEFPDHPFRVVEDEAMRDMVESVKQYGVLTPAVVRKKEDGRYELISGHRRKKACELAGIDKLPVVVKDMSRDEAIIYMVDSNLQRDKILPSEKAFSYRMKLEAIKRQGARNDLTSTPMVSKLRTNETVGAQNGESREQVRRYIRLTELIPPILDMFDEGTIAFRPAVELSYLPIELQCMLFDVMQAEEATPSLSQAQRMKIAANENKLDRNGIELVMREEKPLQNTITIKGTKLDKYFPKDFTPAQKEERIIKALDLYCRRLERMKSENEHER